MLSPLWQEHVDGLRDYTYALSLSSGEVVFLVNQTGDQPKVVYGSGEPNETTLDGSKVPVLAWYDGSDGHLLRVRPVAGSHPSTTGYAEANAQLVESANGDVTVAGNFEGGVTFNPGTSLAEARISQGTPTAGNTFTALEPFVARYTSGGDPLWVRYGASPTPLTQSWSNFVIALLRLGDDVGVVGDITGDGLLIAGGGAGDAKVEEADGSYLARIDKDGNVGTITTHHSVAPTGQRKVGTTPDGGTIWLAYAGDDAMINSSGPGALSVAKQDGPTLIRLGPSGAPEWIRVFPTLCLTSQVFVRANGAIVVRGYNTDLLELADEHGVPKGPAVTLAGPNPNFIMELDSDGDVTWIRDSEALWYFEGIAETPSGELWVAASVMGDGTKISLDGAPAVQLPPQGVAANKVRPYSVMLRIGDTGQRLSAKLLGLALFDPAGVISFASDGGILLSARNWPNPLATYDAAVHPVEAPTCSAKWGFCVFLMRFAL